MNKVYIITYRDEYSNGEVYSGVSYVYDTLEKAKNMIEVIKADEIAEYKDNGYDITDDIKDTENGFIIDRGDFTEYEITEMEVK